MRSEATILCETPCHLGEGPTYDPATGTLTWFDIVERKLFEMPFPGGPVTVQALPIMASVLAVVDERRQLIATETGLFLRDRVRGKFDLVMPIEADNAVTRSNDGRVHPCGALWIGTMGKNSERKAGSIYWFFKGELRRLYPEISIPNSICFAPDGTVAYFTDTAKNILFRVGCDPATGLPVGEPAVFLDWRRQEGGIDGSVTDRDGLLWNARWGAASIDAYDADANRVRSIEMPARQVSCPCFVGPQLDRMVATSAWQGLDADGREADPHAGKTFLLPGRFNGKPEPKVLL